jgi:hypothetical protein
MRRLQLDSWAEFSGCIRDIYVKRAELQKAKFRALEMPLFRGIGNTDWGLETTLERAFPLELTRPIPDLPTYYDHISRSQSSIETLAESDWGSPSTPPKFMEQLSEFESLGAHYFLINSGPLYRYLIYLRHHGYPSPFLDWTASAYVAAFFAFDSMPSTARSVSVYSLVRDTTRVSSNDRPTVDVMGPYVRTHRRHLVQQSQYTICMLWYPGFRFYSHDQALSMEGMVGIDGELIRLTLPASERVPALTDLDRMNINAFSLFGSEDSLVRTIARREGLLRDGR